jgi:hypothetical protein
VILKQKEKTVTISDRDAILAEPVLSKLGYELNDTIEVKDLDSILPELSAWGIPWKRTKWDY